MRNSKFKHGFTLLEIIISITLFALIIAGISGVFVASRRYLVHSRDRMQSAELEKRFLAPLQNSVRADTWNNASNNLSEGSYSTGTFPVGNMNFTGAYNVTNVSNDPNGPQLRKVIMQINWTEPD